MSDRPLHVLFAAPGYKPAYRIGGPVLAVAEMAEGLVRKGHRVTVFATNSNLDQDLDVPVDQPIDVNGVEVWYFRRLELAPRSLPFLSYFSKSLGFLFAPRLAAALERLVPRVDIVHTHMPFIYPSWAAGRAAIRANTPLFFSQHGVLQPQHLKFRSLKKRVYLQTLELPVLRRASTLVALTDAEKQSYRLLGLETPCTVIPNGVAVEQYRTRARQGDAELGIPPGALVVLFLGRLHPTKGADALVRAFLRVAPSHRDAVLVMAGPDEWGVEAQLAGAARDAGLAERVLFTGMVTGERKLDLLARADLFCLPSDGEGFSMAVLEALASGTAVMLSPSCNFSDVVRFDAGAIFGNSVAEIEAGLSALLADRARLAATGVRGRALVSEHYRWEQIVDRLIGAYRDGIERRRH